MRIVFPTDVDTDVSHSEAQFDVVEHAVHPQQPSKKAWREDQPTTYPQQTFVDVASAKRSLCVMNHGLPEYELIENERRELAITLLRAVAYLGAGNDPLTIVGGAGPNMPTPEGQCLRTIRSRFSIMPHTGAWDEAEVWRQAHAFSVRPRAVVRPKIPIIRPMIQHLVHRLAI